MKKYLYIIGLGFALQTMAQNNVPTFIKGDLNINYKSRAASGKTGVADEYALEMNISNSTVFKGMIKYSPLIQGSVYGVSQNATLNFNIDCSVVNPRNYAETKLVARVYGNVPINMDGSYQFDPPAGNLTFGLVSSGLENKFSGVAKGKPLVRKKGWFESIQQEALSLTRGSKGKVVVKKYDKMTFVNHRIPAGPIPIYPEMTVNGEMIYDYDRYVWYFNNVTINYYYNNTQRADRLTGNIRWVEQPVKGGLRPGEYQFDIHINEPPANESALFAAPADESSFFATDSTLPALVGTMKYNDTLSGETVIASKVKVDLVGQKLDKQQVMNLFKLIFFTTIVPFNAE
jgi:hypothetical protein